MSVPRKLSFGDSNGEAQLQSQRRSPNKKTSPQRPRLTHHHSAPGVITTLHAANENSANLPATPNSSNINSKLLNKKPRLRDSFNGSMSPASSGNPSNVVCEVQAPVARAKGPAAPDFEPSSDSAPRPPSPNSTSPTRWAGGAFHNSPPPSKLPVPAFSQSPKRQTSSPTLSTELDPAIVALPTEIKAVAWPNVYPGAPYPAYAPVSYPAGFVPHGVPMPMPMPTYLPITGGVLSLEAAPTLAPVNDPNLAQISRDLRQMLNIRA